MKRQYHDNLTKSRAICGDAATFFAEYQAQKLAAWVPNLVQKSITILDFGCGDGLMTSFMHHIFTYATVHGVDASAEHIALARDMYDAIHFVSADVIKASPFADNTFDLIYATEVFHHLPHAEHARYIAALLHLLKPGGILIIFEFNALNLCSVYRFKKNPHERTAHLIAPWTLSQLLKPYGRISLQFYDFFPNWLHALRTLEPYITWLPFGALYGIKVIKE